ncbi:uncharacterized protein SPPG_08674 [Spizellomyces punctatus DAOM BR117]|uniref:AB hydrolase-1 domain-containing protein n=1 Tax=Spizellomyces punctatus (strain DAOM BR117) TaxID=645134 RepID=A0A0L0H3Y7_SPIPD|nr:uncharacterized protein SPPG_08674 [Spizellomyces punctatus DAOM BR117]KNC95917.1 hypothetical protein SPPG_08674 [Spizellomyces punctatus DAOM BR117]|eukprot:XP_016603957.1 hypothetical protein SPPG_08674 [Spizellomyces punctatus DAOM BR117]
MAVNSKLVQESPSLWARLKDIVLPPIFWIANRLDSFLIVRVFFVVPMAVAWAVWYFWTNVGTFIKNVYLRITGASERKKMEKNAQKALQQKHRSTESFKFPSDHIIRTPEYRFERLADWKFTPRYFEVKGLRVHYVDEGPREGDQNWSGETIVLMHGNPTWSYMYRNVIPVLAERGHRVLALDWIGMGRSDKLVDESDYDLDLHRDTFKIFVYNLKLKNLTLVLQDWSGPIVLLSLPDLPSNTASRLLITDTFLPPEKISDASLSAMALIFTWLVYTTTFGHFMTVSGVIRFMAPHVKSAAVEGYTAPFPSYKYEAGVRVFPKLCPLPYARSPVVKAYAPRVLPGVSSQIEKAAHVGASLDRFRAFANGFKNPVGVVYGEHDDLFKDVRKVFLSKELFPDEAFSWIGRKVVVIRSAGHYSPEDKPDVFTEILLDFLRGEKPSTGLPIVLANQ